MISLQSIVLPVGATLLAYVLLHATQILYRDWTSPLRRILDGPRSPSVVLGNFVQIGNDPYRTGTWRKQFGHTFLFRGLFSTPELHTSDLIALTHIFTHSATYIKSPMMLESANLFLGKGVLAVEREEHKRHVRLALRPPHANADLFRIYADLTLVEPGLWYPSSPPPNRSLPGEIRRGQLPPHRLPPADAFQLRDIWATEIDTNAHPNGKTIEVFAGLRQMALNIIGKAGFDYDFDALQTRTHKPNELNEVFTGLFHSPTAKRGALLRAAQSLAPILRIIPFPGWRDFTHARSTMLGIAGGIVSGAKTHLLHASEEEKAATLRAGGKRDLISVLLKANMSASVSEGQRLSEREIISQIPSFLLAGHETTSTAAAWAFYELSVNPAIQSKLRAELLSVDTDTPSMDELNALPYLELFVREILRVHSPVVATQRWAAQDDVLPLGKPVVGKDGNVYTSLPIPKGHIIHIPIWGVNRSKEVWGEDAEEFNPDRWTSLPDKIGSIPSVWANVLTFLAGPHNCIGFRFALVELKCILFVLLRAFTLESVVPKDAIGPVTAGIIQRPTVLEDAKHGSGLPLLLKKVEAV
ncbi:Cytochrome P450 [Mycena kentingensis (nom. inval.)]|nr:Cytochrome P450 [Mycena kentingensis (nom. inval.)]